MKFNRQPPYLAASPIQISHALELRLAPAQWNRIKVVAWLRQRTYSTITRYCVLKLARRCSLRRNKRMDLAEASVSRGMKIAQDYHRHVMCLYGDDEKLIRIAAMDLGMTMTAFARLAIEMYLGSLAMENHSRTRVSDRDLTCEGIRFIEEIQIFAQNGGPWPFSRHLSCIRYDLSSYW